MYVHIRRLVKKLMRRKQKVTINLEPQIVKKAKELGLNISKVSENALKEYIKRLEGSNYSNDGGKVLFREGFSSKEKGSMVRLPGFEPGLGAWGAPVLDQTGPQPLGYSSHS